MPIEFSDHALEQIRERNLSKTQVKKTVENPDEILPSFRNRELRRKMFGDKILEVVTVTEGSRITIITAYPEEKNMKIKYDSKVDAMSIRLAEGKYDNTRKISDAILVDEDKKGRVLSIEILDASINIPAFDPKKLSIQTS